MGLRTLDGLPLPTFIQAKPRPRREPVALGDAITAVQVHPGSWAKAFLRPHSEGTPCSVEACPPGRSTAAAEAAESLRASEDAAPAPLAWPPRHYPAAQSLARAKFDESVELALKLGIDPRRGDQMVGGGRAGGRDVESFCGVLLWSPLVEAAGVGVDKCPVLT